MTQAERVNKAVGEFGKEATAKLASPSTKGQPEDQLRGPLETLLHALAVEAGLPPAALALVGESSLADMKTRPDYAVTVQKALVGFIEVKAPAKGSDPRKFKDKHDKEQWDKLKALPNLLYTDGNSFGLWRDGVLARDIVRLEGDVETSGAKLKAPPDLLPLLDDFFRWQPIPPKTVPDLARVSARLCRFLRDEVEEQLRLKNPVLLKLQVDWRKLLFPEADDARFADGYAQAVTFGLLMARSRDISLASGLDVAAKELGKSNTLIGTALRLLTEQELSLGPALDTLARVLEVVSWPAIAKGKPEAWLYFYEDFLAVYDNALRKLTGSYYTPPEVVDAMVRLADEALRAPGRFKLAKGLADPGVRIVDPATGSGTFLLAIITSIAARIAADEGEGAVAAAIDQAMTRLYGFELQFGPFAVAQLRLMAETMALGAHRIPNLYVTNTLGDPYADVESAAGIYGLLSQSQADANRVKRETPVTVVIGNPPYKEKAKGKGAWVESGDGNKAAPLADWQPLPEWKAGAHAKHLRNLYVYFWRWATWKVFEQGTGGRDREPPVPEYLSGLVCYITVSGFLNGPGFQKMRADLRRDCDDIWVIDCSPEGHQPAVSTRIFQGVQHPVCIVLASRSPANDPAKPAHVRYRALAAGNRTAKFAELAALHIDSAGWSDCPSTDRAPFLPEFSGGWGDFVALDTVIGDAGSGVMPGRTWIIAPDAQSLQRRWDRLVQEPDAAERAAIFVPHEGGDRSIAKASAKGLAGHHGPLKSVEAQIADAATGKTPAPAIIPVVRYGFRSFDRQWIVPDNRVINRPNPTIWETDSPSQIYLSALMAHSPSAGPAISATALIPDLHHYKGSFGGRVFPLWRDAVATQPNLNSAVLDALSKAHGQQVDPVDLFAYVAALLASPAYTARFKADLVRPGLRVPLTADAALFAEAATLGREILWLHTFGERFAKGRPAGEPRLPADRRPTIPKEGAIPATPEAFPDTIDYDAAAQRLKIGTGFIDRVPPAVWAYEVSGKQVLRQWFSYRKRNRERPQIGDRRKPSPLQDIQPDHWLPEYTSELINVLNILGLLVELEPKQADLLDRIVDGPLIPASRFAA
jgi:hypothetical protein